MELNGYCFHGELSIQQCWISRDDSTVLNFLWGQLDFFGTKPRRVPAEHNMLLQKAPPISRFSIPSRYSCQINGIQNLPSGKLT